uniref:Uncharacterized protein n=1 Tax=Romanomermis culicivorax TaxID=13658 RepID=A0A915L2H8_ROMCU
MFKNLKTVKMKDDLNISKYLKNKSGFRDSTYQLGEQIEKKDTVVGRLATVHCFSVGTGAFLAVDEFPRGTHATAPYGPINLR